MADNGDYYNYLVSCGFDEQKIKQKLKERDIMRGLYFNSKTEPREITSHAYQISQKALSKKICDFLGVKKMNFWILELICVFLQFIGFIPFYLIWRKDCKKIGKENLAVPLKERVFVWLVFCPIWAIPLIQVLKGGVK